MTTELLAVASRNELRVAMSDDEAFRRWYDAVLPRVYAYVISRTAGDVALAEDVTQQTFVAAIDQRARFDGRADATTWLCAIARHKLADHFRRLEREQRRQRRVERIAVRPDGEADTAHWSGPEDRELIEIAMRSLPPMQRAVLVFVALDGLSIAEVARLIEKSAGATQSLLARARDGFRRAYARESTDD